MGQTVNVNFKLDADVKKSMEAACSDMGLSMSAAFTIFAKKVSRERRIPFVVSADPFCSDNFERFDEPNEVTYAAIEASENGEDIHGPFNSVEELMEALNA